MAILTMAILAASCTKEMMTQEEFDEALFVKTTITADATLPGTDSTANADKAYVEDSTRKVIWQSGDQLRINGTDLTVAEIDSGGVRAKFYGTVPALVSGSNYRYWAVYPTNLASSISDTSQLTITLPATQTINTSDLNHPLAGYSYMAGHAVVPQTASRVHFQMRNVGTVLKLTLKANANDFRQRVDKIVFTSNANLTGAFTIPNTLSSNPNFTINSGSGSTTLTVNFSGGSLDISSEKTIYVFLPPLSGKSLNMKIYGGYGLVSYVEVNKTSANLERNTIYSYENKNITFDKVFSVASNRKVIFSPGNLQYIAGFTVGNSAHFRFAPNQWERIGNAAGNTTAANKRATQTAWIDLFGYGTSGVSSKYPYMTSTTNSEYRNANINGTNFDWGVYNKIYNSKISQTDAAGTWRTLTEDEWNYLLFTRTTNATVNSKANARYTFATLTGYSNIKGIILFPDNYSGGTPSGVNWGGTDPNCVNYNSSTEINWPTTCTAAGWTALEQAGCVFLPAAGYRNGTTVDKVNSQAYYWSSTDATSGNNAFNLFRGNNKPIVTANAQRCWGLSVRLVRTHP